MLAERSADLKSISMSWPEPELLLQRGVIIEYSVEQQVIDKKEGETANCSEKPFDSKSVANKSVTLLDIDPSLGYFLRVRARTNASTNFGPASACVLIELPVTEASASASTALVGGIVGGVVGGVVLIGLVIFLRLRRHLKQSFAATSNNEYYAESLEHLCMCVRFIQMVVRCMSHACIDLHLSYTAFVHVTLHLFFCSCWCVSFSESQGH